MGVDWLACEVCGETFPDCGDFVYCECGKNWCDYECASEDGFEELDEDDYPDLDEDERKSCKWCRGEDFSDNDLLSFCMELLSINREQLIELFKNVD